MTSVSKIEWTNKDMFRLIWPLLVEQLLAVLVGLIDTMMVAAVGESAVSAVSLVDGINNLMIQVLAALTTGGAIVCCQFIGEGKMRRASKSSAQLISVSVLGAACIMLFCILSNRSLLHLIFGQTEESVMANAIIYFKWTAISFPFLALYNSCAALFRSMGNSKISMETSLLMNGINIIGNALCIFVLHMGVIGVALPTLISRAIAAIFLLHLLEDSKNQLRIVNKKDLIPDVSILKRILSVGIPNGIENGMFQFGKVILTSLISTLGTSSIAAYAVSYNIATLMYLPGGALGMALTTINGQYVGARDFKSAKRYTYKIMAINYSLLFIICISILLFKKPLIGLYNLSDEAAAITDSMITLHACMMLIWPAAFNAPHTMRASGDARFAMLVSAASMWIFRVGFAYIFIQYFHVGVIGVWYAMTIDWLCRVIINFIHMRNYESRSIAYWKKHS